jgi:hypothetical protein
VRRGHQYNRGRSLECQEGESMREIVYQRKRRNCGPQEDFVQQKQVDKIATKCKDSFCTQSSQVTRLVKKVQPRQQQVRDILQQAKQRDFSSKESNSSRFRFNKHFLLSPRTSMQWIPLLPKEGGLI